MNIKSSRRFVKYGMLAGTLCGFIWFVICYLAAERLLIRGWLSDTVISLSYPVFSLVEELLEYLPPSLDSIFVLLFFVFIIFLFIGAILGTLCSIIILGFLKLIASFRRG